jgi:hypothetical protein
MKRATFVTLLVIVLSIATVGVAFAAVQNYRAHLSGKFEIPLVVDTQAQGQAIFQLSEDGKSLSYKLNAANITNVFMAHIHLLPASGTGNGPIVVWLYPSTPFTPSQTVPSASWIEGRFDGVLAKGTITADNLVGPLAGMSLDKLVAEIEAGHTYVNIHTSDFVPPANTGPGDFPGGEIHGPIH